MEGGIRLEDGPGDEKGGGILEEDEGNVDGCLEEEDGGGEDNLGFPIITSWYLNRF